MVTPSERSGCDLLMQSAGLLILCHMREETTGKLTNFSPDGFVEERLIGRIPVILLIVRTVGLLVKSRGAGGADRLSFGLPQ